MLPEKGNSAGNICERASRIARLPDSYTSLEKSHGQEAYQRVGVRGARGGAESGFPHVIHSGSPMLRNSRSHGLTEEFARMNTLVAIMADLDDTCLLHRGGL